MDGLSDDQKIETQREVQSQIESATDNLSAQVALNLTSIYDHSVFEAFSKCVQRLIPQLPMLENLLNVFISVGNTYIKFVPAKVHFSVTLRQWRRSQPGSNQGIETFRFVMEGTSRLLNASTGLKI